MKYLHAVITIKDMFTSTLGGIRKQQDIFKQETKGVKDTIDKSYKLDKKQLESAISEINDLIKQNRTELKESKQTLDGWQKLTTTSAQNVKTLSKEVQDLSLQKQKLTSKVEEFKNTTNTNELRKYENQLNEINKTLKDKTTTLSKAKSEHRQYTKELSASQKEVSKLDVSLVQLSNKLDTLNRKSKNSFNLQDKSDKINSFYDKFKSEKDKYSGFDKLGNTVKNTGKNMSLGMSLPLTVGLTASLKTGMNFESAMSSVEATIGDKATDKDMGILKQKAMEMGRETTKSATESANAMEYMALAGWDTQQIIGGIEPILRLSEAGKADLATTSDLVTDSMSALGLQVDELGGFLDKVAKTSTSSNTSILQMMEAFIVTGGKSKSLGGDITELAGILGIMANRGLKGSEAGRGLSAILTNLTSPTGQAQKALSQLGFSAFDSQGNFIGLEKTFKELQKSLEGMNQEQKVTYLSMIAGKEHGKTMEAIMNGLSDEYQGLAADISTANGALETMAKTMQDNAEGNIASLKSKLEHLGIKISEHLIPAFTNIVKFAGDIIDKFGNLSPSTQGVIVTLGLLMVAIPPIVTAIGGLISTVSTISGGLAVLKTLLIGSTTSVGLLSKAFVFLAANPVVAIIGALTLIGGALGTLYNSHEWFRDFVHDCWQGILTFVEGIVNGLIVSYNGLIGLINNIPGVNIPMAAEVTWTDSSKQKKLDNFKSSGNGLQASKDSPLLTPGYNTPLIKGSYKAGLDYVPYDGFVAELHRGERVLTAEENKLYSGLRTRDKSNDNDIVKMLNNNRYSNITNTNNAVSNNSSSNVTVNVSVNANGTSNNNIDINNMADQVANIIVNKIRVAKINVI